MYKKTHIKKHSVGECKLRRRGCSNVDLQNEKCSYNKSLAYTYVYVYIHIYVKNIKRYKDKRIKK